MRPTAFSKSRPRNNSCRPGGGRGPYAVRAVFRRLGVACSRDDFSLWLWAPAPVRNCALGRGDGENSFRGRTRPLTDMANEPSKYSLVYSTLSFRVYDWELSLFGHRVAPVHSV